MKAREATSYRDPGLGTAREVEVAQGRLRYFDAGAGPAIVFTQAILVNANLWRKVVPCLAPEFRCITLDLPLGSHLVPMEPDADLSGTALADMIAEAIERIGLEDVTFVGNDNGGALGQILVTRRPERIGRLVLASCDYDEDFPPKLFAGFFKLLPRIHPLIPVLFAPLRLGFPRRSRYVFGWTTMRPIERHIEDSYLLPSFTDRRIRRDLAKVMRGLTRGDTMEAARRLGEFKRPALIAWSREDRIFPLENAQKLADALPNSRLEWIEGARSFSPEDQPERVAELIAEFVRETIAEGTAA